MSTDCEESDSDNHTDSCCLGPWMIPYISVTHFWADQTIMPRNYSWQRDSSRKPYSSSMILLTTKVWIHWTQTLIWPWIYPTIRSNKKICENSEFWNIYLLSHPVIWIGIYHTFLKNIWSFYFCSNSSPNLELWRNKKRYKMVTWGMLKNLIKFFGAKCKNGKGCFFMYLKSVHFDWFLIRTRKQIGSQCELHTYLRIVWAVLFIQRRAYHILWLYLSIYIVQCPSIWVLSALSAV